MLRALSLALLAIGGIASPALAQDRQQAALSERAEQHPSPQHDRRARPHGPVGEAGRSALLERAINHHARGDIHGALAAYDAALRNEPANAVAHLNRGIVLSTHRSEPARALVDFDRALALLPDNVDALDFRGDAHMRLSGYRQALADLDRAVALAPANAQARVLRGLARAMLGDPVQAGLDYTRALALDGRNVDALVNRAALAAGRGDTGAALRDLNAALTVEPRNALALYNRGYVHFVRRDHEAAIRDYGAAIDIDPQFGWAYLNRCLARAVAGRDVGSALVDCDRARMLLPDAPQVRTLAVQIARLASVSATN